VGSPDKDAAEKLLLAELQRGLEKLPPTARVMLKITIPTTPDLYAGIMQDPRMVRVVALSGGYERDDACRKLAQNHGLIASFSRALVENLRYQMSDEEFDAKLAADIAEIYRASTVKV
jgi:fructose-bisphosphate aldolase class I